MLNAISKILFRTLRKNRQLIMFYDELVSSRDHLETLCMNLKLTTFYHLCKRSGFQFYLKSHQFATFQYLRITICCVISVFMLLCCTDNKTTTRVSKNEIILHGLCLLISCLDVLDYIKCMTSSTVTFRFTS